MYSIIVLPIIVFSYVIKPFYKRRYFGFDHNDDQVLHKLMGEYAGYVSRYGSRYYYYGNPIPNEVFTLKYTLEVATAILNSIVRGDDFGETDFTILKQDLEKISKQDYSSADYFSYYYFPFKYLSIPLAIVSLVLDRDPIIMAGSYVANNVMTTFASDISNMNYYKEMTLLGNVLLWAIRYNQLEMIRLLVGLGAEIYILEVSYAAENGHFEVVKFLVEHGAKNHILEVSYAARNGNFEMVKFFVENGAKINDYAVFYAVENGHFEMVRLLVGLGAKINDYEVSYAAKNGNFEVVKFLVENGAKINYYAVSDAAENGHFEVVKFLVENGAKINDYEVSYAAEKGHFEMVKFLVENGAEINYYAVSNAARSGDFEMVKFLLENGAKISYFAVSDAAEKGHFEMVKFLVENGGKISYYAVSDAALFGHFEVVKFLEQKMNERAVLDYQTNQVQDLDVETESLKSRSQYQTEATKYTSLDNALKNLHSGGDVVGYSDVNGILQGDNQCQLDITGNSGNDVFC